MGHLLGYVCDSRTRADQWHRFAALNGTVRTHGIILDPGLREERPSGCLLVTPRAIRPVGGPACDQFGGRGVVDLRSLLQSLWHAPTDCSTDGRSPARTPTAPERQVRR